MSKLRISDSARVLGTLRLGDGVYVAQGSILRSIGDSLSLGNETWVLENSVLIGTPETPLKVGSKTVFGHKCIAIGTEIGDLCEIGNGTIFLPGSKIGNRCIFGEGTIIPENASIPDESVVVGRPGRVIRKLTKADQEMIQRMRGNDITIGEWIENLIENESGGMDHMGKLYEFGDQSPQVAETALIFDSAEITGDVVIGEHSIIGSGVRIVGDTHGPVRIGNNVQILENSVLHLLPDNELIIHDNVTIGPSCIIHGTTIGAGTIIESGAIVCDYSRLGENTLVKSGSLVKQRSNFSDHAILEGFPATVTGENQKPNQRPAWAYAMETESKTEE